jgi:UV DNA damage repair endonuclease
MTILPEKHIQELKDHRNTKNKSETYQRKKDTWKDSELPIKIQESSGNHELKISHHNYLLENKTNPTLDDYINIKHKNLFEKLKGLFT